MKIVHIINSLKGRGNLYRLSQFQKKNLKKIDIIIVTLIDLDENQLKKMALKYIHNFDKIKHFENN